MASAGALLPACPAEPVEAYIWRLVARDETLRHTNPWPWDLKYVLSLDTKLYLAE